MRIAMYPTGDILLSVLKPHPYLKTETKKGGNDQDSKLV